MKTTQALPGRKTRPFEMVDQSQPCWRVVERARDEIQEFFVTARVRPGESLADLYARVGAWLQETGTALVCLDLLGRPGDLESLRPEALVDCPAMYLANSDGDLAGLHLWAVRGVPVRTLRHAGRVVGTVFEDAHAHYCRLTGVLPNVGGDDPARQTTEVFDNLQAGLALADMDYSHVVRTWFYNDRITDWYGPFNQVRTDLYERLGVFERVIPASTGIGSRNAQGLALVGGLLALRPKHDRVSVSEVDSPLQGEATSYGSSFSRAIEVAFPTHRYLSVSGTASIDPEGHSVHLDDPRRQTELTLRVVDGILSSRDIPWTDVSRAYAYFKHARDAQCFDDVRRGLRLPLFACNMLRNDVCRDDLLFELELDVVTAPRTEGA